uniref:TRIM8/14/16/25/29/45/65 coiled-coil region domain-containing protein n=1 Tax=Hucho hucho TaxID=62062 RepID=A0A4W5N0G4_9TELE
MSNFTRVRYNFVDNGVGSRQMNNMHDFLNECISLCYLKFHIIGLFVSHPPSLYCPLSVIQKLIGKTELEILNRIEGKRLRLNELKSRLDTVRNYAQGELSEVEQFLGELSRSVDRICEELVGGMEEKQASVETLGKGLVTRLEVGLIQLQVRRSRLEAQAMSDDHICFLQSFKEASAPYRQTLTPRSWMLRQRCHCISLWGR